MEIFVEKGKKSLIKKYVGTGAGLLAMLGINPETVLLTKNGVLVPLDEKLTDKDKIKIISVISGG